MGGETGLMEPRGARTCAPPGARQPDMPQAVSSDHTNPPFKLPPLTGGCFCLCVSVHHNALRKAPSHTDCFFAMKNEFNYRQRSHMPAGRWTDATLQWPVTFTFYLFSG